MTTDLTLSDFDFALPPELIAQHPPAERGASRLLHVGPETLADLAFRDLESLLAPGSVLVFNDTRVIKARLLGRKPSGGRVEVLVERITDDLHAVALVRTSHAPREGALFLFDDGAQPATARVTGRQDDFFLLAFDRELLPLLERVGRVPLPPYIGHAPDADDASRYQTVYANEPGAVAAPTAGLHFTEALLARLQAHGVHCATLTLHVGAGTFQPVRVERIAEHRMHSERYRIDAACAAAVNTARAEGRPVIAVGTTSLRALEAAAAAATADGTVRAGSSETSIFITPGFRFRAADKLITNFHLPKSTLLMLVSAFAGTERIRAAYAHAIAQRYRFFSYGDAMLLERAFPETPR